MKDRYTPEGAFMKFDCHPRAYGNFARLLGKYVRDEKVMPLEEAIHQTHANYRQRTCALNAVAN